MNIILIIVDSWRQDHVGAYGNPWIKTPHLDQLARESVLFTRAYPESLPTLPVRRALHTGLRTYPFQGHHDYKGDFSGAPGWGPIPEEQDTVAEVLAARGYRTAFVTDCYHQFKPSKNFHRGFQEWIWVRGQENDPFKSGPALREGQLAAHIPPDLRTRKVGKLDALERFLTKYLLNNAYRMTEADYYPARVFAEAARWVWDNQDAKDLFLVVDSFDPHEPWDPPAYYRRMYDPDNDVLDVIHSLYSRWEGKLTPRQVRRVQGNYAGEVTMVDRWLGFFLETLRTTGRMEDTLVAVISDHGHNIGLDPGDKGYVSKQGHPMTHAVADLIMTLRHPSGQGAGTRCEALCYNHDLTATLLALAGEEMPRTDGINLWPIATLGKAGREYVTVAWGPLVTVITDEWWYNANIWGEGALLYKVREDRNLEHNLAAQCPEVCERLRALAVQDAGGSIPPEFANYRAKPGCTPFLE